MCYPRRGSGLAWLLYSVVIGCVLLQEDRRHRRMGRRLKGRALREKNDSLYFPFSPSLSSL